MDSTFGCDYYSNMLVAPVDDMILYRKMEAAQSAP